MNEYMERYIVYILAAPTLINTPLQRGVGAGGTRETVSTRILHLVLRVLRNGSIWLSPEALVQAKRYAKKSAIVPRFALAVY